MAKPSLLRHLAAVCYDFLLLIAVLFFATALLLPFNDGKAFDNQIFYSFYLLFVSFLFYGWFWTHGGQTLGLRAWQIKVLCNDHQQITWRQASIRFIISIVSWSCLGLGFLWALIDKERRSWHDLASKTELFQE